MPKQIPTEQTPLDAAHAAMQAAPEDATARLRFFERLADTELFLLLEKESDGDDLSPESFAVTGGHVILVFDLPERLTQFTARVAPYAAMPGRVIVAMLAGQGIGLGVNLDVAPSSILLPADNIDWLADLLARQAPARIEARIDELSQPRDLPEALLSALDAKLAACGGLAEAAWLVGTSDARGRAGHLLGFIGAAPGAEAALAGAIAEALAFSGVENGALDVGFFAARDPMAARLAALGLGFELPAPEPVQPIRRAVPGSDPEKPPILR